MVTQRSVGNARFTDSQIIVSINLARNGPEQKKIWGNLKYNRNFWTIL
jgi:hypothetical protein